MTLHQRLYLSATAIFIVGVLLGMALYVTAAPDESQGNFVIIGGQAYTTDPSTSKSYDDQLERMGGQSLVFADRFSHWFGSRWHGANLGLTVATLATVLALILLWIGREVKRDHEYRNRSRSDSD
jgi:hypothetical protein